ncbi:MAG TPA: hypothetical protein VIM70_03065 [Clostridium sp.]|uniref:hypothetical protein n=1 Tax=Clostridium sp. TaxID=1506 RepID=UPI002F943175
MGLFDNLKAATKATTESLSKAANAAVSTVVTASRENAKLNNIKTEIISIDGELDAAYKQIGEKYVEYVLKTNEMPGIDVSDILKFMEPKLEKKDELKKELIEIEKRLKDQVILQEKSQLEEQFKLQKESLDKALAMNIMSEQEYDEKLMKFRKKIDNFEAIRNTRKQYELRIISYDELQSKIQDLT